MKIYKQESNISCGIACLRSIFNYCGKSFTEKEILDKTDFFKKEEGVLNPVVSLGVTALKFGFKVTYIGFNPIVANNQIGDLTASLKEKSKTYFDFGKFTVDKTLEFINLGGDYKIERLDIKKIKSLIDKHKFIIAEIRPAFITNSFLSNIHKIIIDGYNKSEFHILDPSGKKYYVPFKSFLMAFYAAMPEILVIEK